MKRNLEEIKYAATMLRGDPQLAYYNGVMEQLAKQGIPRLLAITEAAVEWVDAEQSWLEIGKMQGSSLDEWRKILKRYDMAKIHAQEARDALFAAVAALPVTAVSEEGDDGQGETGGDSGSTGADLPRLGTAQGDTRTDF